MDPFDTYATAANVAAGMTTEQAATVTANTYGDQTMTTETKKPTGLPASVLQKSPRVRTPDLPKPVRQIVMNDRRVTRVTLYLQGWVPNSYRYPAPGTAWSYYRRPGGWWVAVEGTYDRKRSRGEGPRAVGFSEAGGRLVSV